jgi:hypothetical protein
MLKNLLLLAGSIAFATAAAAQITITAADMPVSGDTLRSSAANPAVSVNFSTTGANTTWNYASLVPVSQTVDTYKTALQVNAAYAVTISPNAYGYKVFDTLSAVGSQTLPISVEKGYTFFSKKPNGSPNRFVAEGFGAIVAGFPTPAAYDDEDEWYFFPLAYGDHDTSTFHLNVNILGLGSLIQSGTRHTMVDGWGTVTTPYFTSPVNCIRVRSEVTEIDSVVFNGTPLPPIPRHYVEYKWLANNQHYPVLWITTNVVGSNETVTGVRYRDSRRQGLAGIAGTNTPVRELKAYPNPAVNGYVQLDVPAAWKVYTAEVFDMQGRLMQTVQNNPELDLRTLAAGNYLVRVSAGAEAGFVRITK